MGRDGFNPLSHSLSSVAAGKGHSLLLLCLSHLGWDGSRCPGTSWLLLAPVAAGTKPFVLEKRSQCRALVRKIGAAAPEPPSLVYENYNYFDFSPQTA